LTNYLRVDYKQPQIGSEFELLELKEEIPLNISHILEHYAHPSTVLFTLPSSTLPFHPNPLSLLIHVAGNLFNASPTMS
jgi:hypothetical protein